MKIKMRWTISLWFILVMVINGFSQNVEIDSIPNQLESDSILLSKKRKMTTRWLMFDIGWNSLLPTYNNVSQSYYDTLSLNTARSLHYSINIFRQRISLKKHKLNLEYGLALDIDRFSFKESFNLAPYNDRVTPISNDTIQFKKNTLNITSLSVPLLLEYESNPLHMKKSFHVSLGGYAGFILGAKQKTKTDDGIRKSEKGAFNLSNIQYGIQTEIGYSYLTFFSRIGFHSFFLPEEDNGYGFRNLIVGIRIIPFY